MATTQNISMTDELASFVTQQVESGDYASVSEVYREALRGFRDRIEAQKKYKELVYSKIEASKQAHQEGNSIQLAPNGIKDFISDISAKIRAKHL